MIGRHENGVTLFEDYKDGYSPTFDVVGSVTELLHYVPQHYLRLLDRVEVTNASALARNDAAKPTSWPGIRVGDAFGLYYAAVPGNARKPGAPAHIKLFVDNIVDRHANVFDQTLALVLGPSVRLATPLFHEIGHHIHKTAGKGCTCSDGSGAFWGSVTRYRCAGFGSAAITPPVGKMRAMASSI